MRIGFHASHAHSWPIRSRESAPIHVCGRVLGPLSFKMGLVSCLGSRNVSLGGVSLAHGEAAGSIGVI